MARSLHDGLVVGMWWQAGAIDRRSPRRPARCGAARQAIAEEGTGLLSMLLDGSPTSADDVRFESPA